MTDVLLILATVTIGYALGMWIGIGLIELYERWKCR